MADKFDLGINLSQPRFTILSDTQIKDLEKKKRAKKTENATKIGMNTLKEFCEETQMARFDELKSVPENELCRILKNFWASARKKDGQRYKVNALKGLRFALQRYFVEIRGLDIINEETFREANTVFDNILKLSKSEGFGDTDHYPEIEPEDLQKLYASFDVGTPTGLQEKVWFDIMFQLIRRGRENMRLMTKSSFICDKDAAGKELIAQNFGEADKNHTVNDHPFDTTGEGRIYSTKNSSCPVKCYKNYIAHLHPMCESLWQHPRPSANSTTDAVWYSNSPQGEKWLGEMLPRMSIKYGLSQRYTNHSLRVTSLQILEDCQVDARHVIRVSGHKQTDSLQHYARRLSASRKRHISGVLASTLISEIGEEDEDENRQSIIQNIPPSPAPSMSGIDLVDVPSDIDGFFSSLPDELLLNSTNFQAPANFQAPMPRVFQPMFNNCSHITINFS